MRRSNRASFLPLSPDGAVTALIIRRNSPRLYLQQSAALERFWSTPITAVGLRRELERMSRGTRMPERLQQLYSALDDGPLLIQECLARPPKLSGSGLTVTSKPTARRARTPDHRKPG